MSQKTRSKLRIDAVATAAAMGAANALNPLNKIGQIAALAGFVLRLFRSKQQSLPQATTPRPKRQEGSPKGARKQPEGNMGGLRHG